MVTTTSGVRTTYEEVNEKGVSDEVGDAVISENVEDAVNAVVIIGSVVGAVKETKVVTSLDVLGLDWPLSFGAAAEILVTLSVEPVDRLATLQSTPRQLASSPFDEICIVEKAPPSSIVITPSAIVEFAA